MNATVPAHSGRRRHDDGNRLQLLQGGGEYFPRLLAAIDAARHSIELETYLFADDSAGQRVLEALAQAAARGVRVRVTVDGFGAGADAPRLAAALAAQGGELRTYRPARWWRLERSQLRRLHRKIAVIDGEFGFVGGINVIDDYTRVPVDPQGRRNPRLDFAVLCDGPIVADIGWAARRLWWALSLADWRRGAGAFARPTAPRVPAAHGDGVSARLVLRDNLRHRHAIERAYLEAIRGARRSVLIACAYFNPGRTVRAALRAAAARGVQVRLLLQGRAEHRVQHHAQQALYGQLLAAGIEIHQYTASFLHAKVATVDDRWATVGSSNIDPFSLLLAREANVVVRDAGFAVQLRRALERAMADGALRLRAEDYANRPWWVRLADWVAYGLLRWSAVVLARGRDY